MLPEHIVSPQLINHCRPLQTIIICGYTKTGKITIAKNLAKALNRKLFISDDYLHIEPEAALYKLMDDVMIEYKKGTQIIIEGVLCFRLLRKGIQLNNFFPDLIIKTKCNDETIRYFYKKDNEESKLERALSFNKGLNKIWLEYLNLLSSNSTIKKPTLLEFNTSIK